MERYRRLSVSYTHLKAGAITREEAFTRAQEPMKEFMLKQTEKKSLDLFLSISKTEVPDVSGGPEGYMLSLIHI